MAVTGAATEKYDAIAKDYDQAYVGPRWDLYDEVTLATATPFMPPPGGSILDAGAGSGKFSLRFLARGYAVTLLDPSKEMLAQAKAKIDASLPDARADYHVGSIDAMEFPDASFDFVFCEGDPLSYCIATHRQAAAEILRVLRPGGAFYVSVDNRWLTTLAFYASGRPAEAIAAAREGKGMDPYGVPVHAFDPDELRALFEGLGARDVRVAGKVCLATYMSNEALERALAPEHRADFLALETALAANPATAALGGHIHVVGRKGGAP